MWSGFDVISHPELAAQFSDSFPCINDIFQAVFFLYTYQAVRRLYFFKHLYMYIAVGFFFIVYIVFKSPVFVQNIPECIICTVIVLTSMMRFHYQHSFLSWSKTSHLYTIIYFLDEVILFYITANIY